MFIWFALGFIGLIFFSYQLASLKTLGYLLPILIICWAGLRWQSKRNLLRLRYLAKGSIIGVLWLIGWLILNPPIDSKLLNQPVLLQGKLVELAEKTSNSKQDNYRLELRIQKLQSIKNPQQIQQFNWLTAPKVRLNCYQCNHQFIPNQAWLLQAKLKQIHGSMNPGSFDYEGWAHSNRIQARGYILEPVTAKLLTADFGWQNLRYQFAESLQKLLADSEFSGIYQALLYAGKQEISDQQWQVLQKTGTIHLMAISGLHIGLVASIGFLLGSWLWRLPIKRFERYPVQWFGLGFALVFMSFYALLAGFSIPTQRAWIMGLTLILFLILRRKLQVWPVLLLAGVLVVAWNPPSVLAQGFWLSFLAVAAIFIWLQTSWSKRLNTWQNLIALQLVISIGLMPALWWFYQQVPVYSLPANLVAVPFVSLIGLPLLLLIAALNLLLTWLAPGLVELIILPLISLSDYLWRLLWWLLAEISSWQFGYWQSAPKAWWQVAGVYILLFALWWRIRKSSKASKHSKASKLLTPGLVGLLVALWFYPIAPSKLAPAQARINLLDVGQGLSLVVETQNHVLVYDTGPKFSDRFNGATIAIMPFFRHQGWSKIDHLMISHADLDHAGGTASLLQEWPAELKTTGEAERLNQMLAADLQFESCHDLADWSWDGVKFEILSAAEFNPTEPNDFSCGLKITAGEHSLVVTGDMSSKFEDGLLNFSPLKDQRAQLLIAGHHGSRYSTSNYWLQTLQPEYLLFSAGWQNSYGFPHPKVVTRAEQQQIKMLNTACAGMISFEIGAGLTQALQPVLERQRQQRWYHSACDSSSGK